MFRITLKEQDLNNLKIFLGRVNLTGQEVPAFSILMNAIYEAKPVETESIKEKPKKVGE